MKRLKDRFVADVLCGASGDRFALNYDNSEEGDPIKYLTERLMNETKMRSNAERMEQSAYYMAKKCIEIYGLEAIQRFEHDWQRLKEIT